MRTIKFEGHLIYYEDFKYHNNEDLKLFIDEKKYVNLLKSLDLKVVLVLGWDWTMLAWINKYLHLWLPFLWLNFWNKWFLLNDLNYSNNVWNYTIKKYPILESFLKNNDTQKTFYSFNEIDIRSWNGRILTLDIQICESKSIKISWDWIIISTPSGSTWYNSSLWWPIIPHDLNAFVITPKAPWMPKWQTPILLNDDKVIYIKNSWRKNYLEVYSDSNIFYNWDSSDLEIIIKKSIKKVELVVLNDYLEVWEEKVLLEQWFNT